MLDSRLADEGMSIRRRRECQTCLRRFTTFERYEEARMLVVKKDGRRERFDKNKMLGGVARAIEKRPIEFSEAEALVSAVDKDLRSRGENEISSEAIGQAIMDRLLVLDEVAYVRFASVYKEFKDVSRFSEELKALEDSRRRFPVEEIK